MAVMSVKVVFIILVLSIINQTEGRNKRVRIVYVTDLFMEDDNGVQQLRKSALSEVAYIRYVLSLMKPEYYKGFVFEVDIRSHTKFLNKYILNQIVYARMKKEPIDAIIGPESSNIINNVIGVNQFLSVPLFTCGATASTFDHIAKSYSIIRYLPSDAYRTAMLIQLVDHYQWNFLAVLSSKDTNAFEAIKFEEEIDQNRPVKIGFRHEFNVGSDICGVVRTLDKKPIRVVILFTTTSDTRRVLYCMRNQSLYDRFTLVFYYASNMNPDVTEGYEKMLDGSIGLQHHPDGVFKRFYDHFEKLNPLHSQDSSLIKLYWERAFNCNAHHLEGRNPNNYFKNCTFKETLKKNRDSHISASFSYIRRILKTLANMVKKTLKPHCYNYQKAGICDEYIESPEFSFEHEFIEITKRDLRVENFDNTYPHVSYYVMNSRWNNITNKLMQSKKGEWEIPLEDDKSPRSILKNRPQTFKLETIWWGKTLGMKPPSGRCSVPCKPGQVYIYNINIGGKFCWECVSCKTTEIVVNNTCVQCSKLEYPDLLHRRCLPKIRIEFRDSENKPIVYSLWVLIASFILLTLIVAVTVICNRTKNIFRASGFVLWLLILSGILFCLLGALTFSLPTSDNLCIFQLTVPSFGLVLCHLALCAKTCRINHSFVGIARSLHLRLPLGKNPYEKSVIIFATLHVVIMIAVLTNQRWSKVVERNSTDYISRHCSYAHSPLLFIAYTIVILLSSIETFKIRNFPQNYAEAKDIAITILISIFLLFLVIPVYILEFQNPYFKEIYLSFFYVSNAVAFIVFLFSKKMFILLRDMSGRGHSKASDSPRLRTFSENIISKNDISGIKSIVESHATLPKRVIAANPEAMYPQIPIDEQEEFDSML